MRAVGMSRSGGHAIIGWILANSRGRWCFLDCAEPKEDPFATARPTDDGRPWRANFRPFDPAAEAAGRHAPKDLLLYSHEDTFLGPAFGPAAEPVLRRYAGPGTQIIDLLILRDPYNLFASRRRLGYWTVSERTASRIWKQHARAFLAAPRRAGGRLVRIAYNAWVESAGYRRALARRLGLAGAAAGLGRVAPVGGGSSFDGFAYEGRALEMPVLERWRQDAADPAYRRLFDEETHALAAAIFGGRVAAAGAVLRAGEGRGSAATAAAGRPGPR